MKLYYIFILTLATTVNSIFAQPNIALANKLEKPVYYSIGKAGSSTESALNKPLEALDPRVGAVAKTLNYNIGLAGTEVLLSSKPGEAELFQFTPGKTMYVDIKQDKAKNVILTPQSGTLSSFWKKTDRGYPLSNNVTQNDIKRTSLTSLAIPATNPQAFLKIYGPRNRPGESIELQAEPRVILGIPAGRTSNKTEVGENYYYLSREWKPNKNTTSDEKQKENYNKVFTLIKTAGEKFIGNLK